MSDLAKQLSSEKHMLDVLSKYTILIGVVSAKTKRKVQVASLGITNAELMFIHENGSPLRNIPERPVLEMTIRWVSKSELLKTMNRCVDIILEGGVESEIELELKKLCLRMEKYARKIIYDNDGRLAPNSPSVAARKKGNHPLFDTGQLARSITCTLKKM